MTSDTGHRGHKAFLGPFAPAAAAAAQTLGLSACSASLLPSTADPAVTEKVCPWQARRFGQLLLLIVALLVLCLGGGPAEGAPGATSSLQAVDDLLERDRGRFRDRDRRARERPSSGRHAERHPARRHDRNPRRRAHRGTEPNRPPNIVFVLTDDQSASTRSRRCRSSASTGLDRIRPRLHQRSDVLSVAGHDPETGLYSHHTRHREQPGQGQFDDSSTIATWLDAAGYRTGLFGKYHLGTHGEGPTYIPPGWDDWVSFPDGAYYNYTLNENGTLVHYGSTPKDYSTDVLAAKTLKFINASDGTTPFFALSRDALAARRIPARRPIRECVQDRADPAHRSLQRGRHVRQAELVAPPRAAQDSGHRQCAPQAVREPPRCRRRGQGDLPDTPVERAAGQDGGRLHDRQQQSRSASTAGAERAAPTRYACTRRCSSTTRASRGAGRSSELVSNVDIAPTFAELGGTNPGSPVDGKASFRS